MRRRFTCIISWYQEIEFLIWRNWILDIKKCIFGYQEMYFLISRNAEWIVKRPLRIYFLISRNGILDIGKWVFLSRYQEFDFLRVRILFLPRNGNISWYQEFDFLISRIHFLISRIHFLISRNLNLDINKWNLFLDINKWNLFLDIKKSISWYQELELLISRVLFLDIKKY